ncbi:MAG: DUF5011 domain-containing protein [Clostridiales bacterium]|nr:DUF5011 domain-containing protein [Clostridiales bacterium]
MKKWKAIILAICLCLGVFVNISINNNMSVSASRQEIKILDENLDARLRTLLGKDNDDKFYSDDFLTHENYKATYDEEKEVYTSNISCLDLSKSKVTNIIELAKFTFPTTLKSINLSYNNIINEHFEKIYEFSTITADSEVKINNDSEDENNTFTAQSDFNEIIKCIYVSFNNLDLANLSNEQLENSVFIYGFQNFDSNINKKLINKNHLDKATYYIKDSDFLATSYTAYYYTNPADTETKSNFDLPHSQIGHLNNLDLGKYTIGISYEEFGYLHNIPAKSFDFIVVECSLLPNKGGEHYEVERLSMLNILAKDIRIDGLGSLEYTAYNKIPGSTQNVGTEKCSISIEVSGYENTTIDAYYQVVDTTPPQIILQSNTITWGLNVPWQYPECIVKDNGETVTTNLIPKGTVKYTEIGEYILTYEYEDQGKNKTTATLKVIVEEGILSVINLYTTNEDVVVGKEIQLIAEPYNITNSLYKDFKYEWYKDGELFLTTEGDDLHKSITSFIPESSQKVVIQVKATATNIEEGKEVVVYSNKLTIEPNESLNSSMLTTIIFGGAVAILTVTISIITIRKSRKLKISTKSKKPKNNKSNTPDKDEKNITIIRDYKK